MPALNAPLREDTAEELTHRLRQHLGSRLRGVRVHVRDNGLILQGVAKTYYAKQVAQHAIMRLTNLPILANEIEVR